MVVGLLPAVVVPFYLDQGGLEKSGWAWAGLDDVQVQIGPFVLWASWAVILTLVKMIVLASTKTGVLTRGMFDLGCAL